MKTVQQIVSEVWPGWTLENRIGADKQSKAQYLFRRIFPPMKQIQVYDPFFYRHKWLIPVLWIWRPIRGLTRRRGQIAGELRYLRQKKVPPADF